MNAAATCSKRKERDSHRSPPAGGAHLAGEKRARKRRRTRHDQPEPRAHCLASNKYLALSVTSAHLLQEEYRQGATLAVHELHYLKGNNKEKKEELLQHLDYHSDGPAPTYRLGAQLELLGSNGCALACGKCWPKHGASLVKINHRGGPLIATPLNINIKIKVMCRSFHHDDQPLQVRLWIDSGHHLLEGTIALGVIIASRETKRAFALATAPLPNSVHLRPTINLDDLDSTFLLTNERANDHDHRQPCQAETDDAPPLPQLSDAASHQDSSAICSLSLKEIEHLVEVLFGHGVESAQAREEINRLPY